MKPSIPIVARTTLLILLLALASVSSGEIYKWKDAEGRTHVSDRPPANQKAERLQIRSFQETVETSTADRPAASGVVMLSATWCGVYNRARSWMTQNGIAFTEYDVEQSETGKNEFLRLGGRGVPIILVGDRRMNGFSAARLKTMLDETGSAKR